MAALADIQSLSCFSIIAFCSEKLTGFNAPMEDELVTGNDDGTLRIGDCNDGGDVLGAARNDAKNDCEGETTPGDMVDVEQ